MSDLTSLAEFKTHAGISGSDDDTRNQALLDAAEAAVLRSMNRKFISAERTEYYSGSGKPRLYLRERPLTSVGGVWVDSEGYFGHPSGAFAGSNDEWTEGTDFVPELEEENEDNAASLLAINAAGGNGVGFWPKGQGNIKVTYTAGYATCPQDLKTALHLLTDALVNAAEEGRAGPVESESLGRYSYKLLTANDATGADLVTARKIVAGYREAIA